jgi:hypothetical protein
MTTKKYICPNASFCPYEDEDKGFYCLHRKPHEPLQFACGDGGGSCAECEEVTK